MLLAKDAEKARSIIEEEKIIEEREWKLVRYIENIELIFNSYLDYPTDTFTERGILFQYKSFSSRYVSLPSIDLIISLGIPDEANFFIVHSSYAQPEDRSLIAGETEYGATMCSVIAKGMMIATQFHPEKSGEFGLKMYDNFIKMVLATM